MHITPSPANDGFSVDPAHLQGVAGQIANAIDDLSTEITQFGGDHSDVAEFGTPVAEAWSNFAGAWAQELQTFGLALTEMSTKVEAAGADYAKADAKTADEVKNVGG
jgi:uncharacterized protein YukE